MVSTDDRENMNETCAAGAGLDATPEQFRRDLREASELVVRLHERLEDARVTPDTTPAEIAALFDEALPEDPQPMTEILHAVEERIVSNSTLYSSPHFFGYINGSGNQAAVVAELVAAAVNQICAKWHFSPAATEVERRVVRWMARFVGYAPDAAGSLQSGGSAGNLVGLAVARHEKGPRGLDGTGMRGSAPPTAYVSQEGQATLDKAMALLGMGREQLRRIAVREDFTIDLDALARQVDADRRDGYRPICVVANAGSTNTGAIDPLDVLADFCRAQDLWLHVDAAYGGPAAATGIAGPLFRGMDRADSIVVNPHKWLYVPVEASCVLVRDARALRETFQVTADYFRREDHADDFNGDGPLDFKDYGPQLSRSFRALKVWMTFKAYGARALRAAVESNIRLMHELAERIDRSADFVRCAPVPLSIVCFQYRTSNPERHGDAAYLDTLNARLLEALERDGRVFVSGTKIQGRNVLRACSVNHRLRREHLDTLLQVIREVGASLATP